MIVGLCTVIAAVEMVVQTFAFSTYELALDQARELLKGVTGPIDWTPERRDDRHGLRCTIIRAIDHAEVIQVKEVEVADAVLPVPDVLPALATKNRRAR